MSSSPATGQHCPSITAQTRYRGIRTGTCVGVRRGYDFRKVRPITAMDYAEAFAKLRSLGERVQPLFVLGDVPDAWQPFANATGENATQIDEDDVVQLAIARHCRNFVVSHSTFHVWMAYVAIQPRYVVAFNWTGTIGFGGLDSPPWMEPWIIL